MRLDKIDKHILNILQIDSKITNAALAEKINLSPAATLERVKKLEQREIITHYTAQVDYLKLGLTINLIAAVSLQKLTPENIKSFKLVIDKTASIRHCYQVIGEFDFILIVHVSDMYSYQTMVIEKLDNLPFVKAIKTLWVTQLIKDKTLVLE